MSVGRFVEQPRAETQQRHEMYQYAKVRPIDEGPERARWVTQARLTGGRLNLEGPCIQNQWALGEERRQWALHVSRMRNNGRKLCLAPMREV